MFCVVASFKSQGILFVEFVEVFGASNALTAWMMGVTACGMSVFSPAATYFAKRYSSRVVVAVGSVLCSLSALLASVAPNIYFVIGVYGLITGIGYACLYGPSLIPIGMYFIKRRTLANGLALSGASVGQLVIPVMMTYLIRNFTVWWALRVYAAFLLHGLVAALLMRPTSFYTRKRVSDKTNGKNFIRQSSYDSKIHSCDMEDSVMCSSAAGAESQPEDSSFLKKATENKIKTTQPDVDNSDTFLLKGTNQSTVKTIQPSENKLLKLLHSITKAFECRHLKNPLYIIYLLACVVGNSAYVDHSLYIPPYAKSLHITKETASYLLAIVGIGDFFGRILGGFFADFGLIKRSQQMSIAMMAIGLTTIVCTFLPGFTSLCVLCVVLGFIGGTYVSMYTVVLIDFLGLKAFPSAFGLMIMFQGMFNTILPIFLGLLKDVTGDFVASFYILGSCMLFSGSVLLLEPVARKSKQKTSFTLNNIED